MKMKKTVGMSMNSLNSPCLPLVDSISIDSASVQVISGATSLLGGFYDDETHSASAGVTVLGLRVCARPQPELCHAESGQRERLVGALPWFGTGGAGKQCFWHQL